MVGTGTSEDTNVIVGEPTEDGGIILNSNDHAGTDDDGTIPIINPAEIIIPGDTVSGDGPKRRGRKPGSKNRSSGPTQKETSGDLAGLLLSIHMMGAMILKTPELELTPDESEKLGAAVARVNKEFGVQIMSPKMAALVNLGIVAGTVYGPRGVVLWHKARKEKDAKTHAGVNGAGAVADYMTQ